MTKVGKKVYKISKKVFAIMLVFLMTVSVLPGPFAVEVSKVYAADIAPALVNGLSFVDDDNNDTNTVITLGAPSVVGNTFVYKISENDNPVPTPNVGDDLSTWTAVADGISIEAVNGKHIGVAEIYIDSQAVPVAVQFSDATAVTEAEPAQSVAAPTLAGGLSFADDDTNDTHTIISLGNPSASGNTFVYKISTDVNAVPTPNVGDDLSAWTAVANGDSIEAVNGKHIGVAEIYIDSQAIPVAVQFSDATAVTEAELALDIYVSPTGSYKSIQEGINNVAPGGTVHVAAGIYQENLIITKDVTLEGAGESNTIIDGKKSGTVINNAAGYEVDITGFTITNGKALDGTNGTNANYNANFPLPGSPGSPGSSGGGIYNDGGTVRITDCTITGNSAGDGGYGGDGGVNNNITFGGSGGAGGNGGSGGGIYNSGIGTIRITGCTITGNRAGAGGDGGTGGTGNINDGVGNRGGAGGNGGAGGGIYNSGIGTVRITGCTITGNITGDGGNGGTGGNGGYMGQGSSGGNGGNGGSGGGIWNYETVEITGCTITGNITGDGGAVGAAGATHGFTGGSGGSDGDGSAICSVSGSVDATDNWWGTTLQENIASRIVGLVDVSSPLAQEPSGTIPLTITTNNLPAGIIGESYSASLQASGGMSSYTWQATGLPGGLSINGNSITGTPTTTESWSGSVTVTVKDNKGNIDSKTYTLILDKRCGNGKYLVIPVTDNTNYNNSFTNENIPMMTVKTGISGLKYFSVNIHPVTGHSGDEVAVFVHLRGGVQVGFSAVRADFDEMNTAQAAFNVQPGDVVKVYLFDNLNNNDNSNPTLL